MADALGDAVLFRSGAFSLEPPVERGVPYDLPLGDDLADLLRRCMLEAAPKLWIDEPIREDWGTVLWVKDGGEEYYINIHWMASKTVEDRWGIQFSRPVGFLRALLGRKSSPRECRPMQSLVGEVISAQPDVFTEVECCRKTSMSRVCDAVEQPVAADNRREWIRSAPLAAEPERLSG